MNRLAVISIISILLSLLMLVLFFIIPGFPLLIFLFLPPLFCWGLQGQGEESSSTAHPIQMGPRYCPQCGKQLLEPFETYCPRCGAVLKFDD
ncbi:MAG: zinc-ribbon domain-containing protein [Promethearchaeota archaeon]